MNSRNDIRLKKFISLLNSKPYAGNDKSLARALGYKSGAMVYQLRTGLRPITEKTAHRIDAKLKKPEGWFDFVWDKTEGEAGQMVEIAPLADAVTESAQFLIPHMNGRPRGGAGGLAPTHEYVVGSISVTMDFIHRKLPSISSKENLVVVEAYGRSMEPTLMSGDLLIVDCGVVDAKIDGIYILLRNNTPEPELMVKRLQRKLDGSLIVRSDNRAKYDPEEVAHDKVDEQVKILGRVVWVWAGREA